MTSTYYCVTCSEPVNPARRAIGYLTCLCCGERKARTVQHCIVPMAKSAYQPVRDLEILKQLNKYANT